MIIKGDLIFEKGDVLDIVSNIIEYKKIFIEGGVKINGAEAIMAEENYLNFKKYLEKANVKFTEESGCITLKESITIK